VVHLHGLAVNMEKVMAIAKKHHLKVIEDCCQAHGATYKGRKVGSLGDIGAFSFYGNKVITTGEGGMVVTGDARLDARVRLLKGQGMDPARRYWFPVVGYNYRMTNIEAAIGLAQLERIDWHIRRRREIAARYAELLRGVEGVELHRQAPDTEHAFWMTTVRLRGELAGRRDAIMEALERRGVETRPVFHPMHTLPMYASLARGGLEVAEAIAASGFNLPSYALLEDDDQEYVCDALKDTLREGR